MNKFYAVANESDRNSWVDVVWSDINKDATIFLDNNTLKSTILKRIKKIHFSNKLNRYIWIPFKSIWDNYLVVDRNSLNEDDKNIIIFQSNIKFSPRYINYLKKKKNAVIVLYLPDTIKGIGIGNSYNEFKRYSDYYQIDYVFSFDPVECNKYGFCFFDIYSRLECEEMPTKDTLFYIGSCRNNERLKCLLDVYEKLRNHVVCRFNLVGVDNKCQKYSSEISYNKPLNYHEVIESVVKAECLLEILNEGQSGNTFRFKEAICYNKKLLTNNVHVLKSPYYNSDLIQYFDNINKIDLDWFGKNVDIDYKYKGEFSPKKLLELISDKLNY